MAIPEAHLAYFIFNIFHYELLGEQQLAKDLNEQIDLEWFESYGDVRRATPEYHQQFIEEGAAGFYCFFRNKQEHPTGRRSRIEMHSHMTRLWVGQQYLEVLIYGLIAIEERWPLIQAILDIFEEFCRALKFLNVDWEARRHDEKPRPVKIRIEGEKFAIKHT